MAKSNYDKHPFVQVEEKNASCVVRWPAIVQTLAAQIQTIHKRKKIIVVECYQGVLHEELMDALRTIEHNLWIDTEKLYKDEAVVQTMTYPDVTGDAVFGYCTRLVIDDYFDLPRLEEARRSLSEVSEGTIVIYGTGAALVADDYDLLVYADMPRWEIQQRMRRNEVANLGRRNHAAPFSEKYKIGFFVDWRVCDRHKKASRAQWNFVLDTTVKGSPKLVKADAVKNGLARAASQPFRVVPFFDPGPWGGQWMKAVCDLDRSAVNYAWCFDCVPEENSLLLGFGDVKIEIPSLNLVFFRAKELLGEGVQARFGDEFPIRFDFLDTIGGGNLSLQVHPLTSYIQQGFGMHYTQDESYYVLDAGSDACVYLGLKQSGTKEPLFAALEKAHAENTAFPAETFVNKWPVKKHDHLSIPAGTIHCSGANTMVLEISATPYLFTFKLWDWNRLGLDGKPRPIHLRHGKAVLQDDRDAAWVKKKALNLVRPIDSGDGWREETTGLNELEFIETRRHWFTKKVQHHTEGNLHVLNLVEGREAVVESPHHAFEPFVVHYAETFIVPASVGAYTVRPFGESEGAECATIKAYVRF